MAKRSRCAECGKDAIKVQSFGCRRAYVCQDHAYGLLLALVPDKNIRPENVASNAAVLPISDYFPK